MKETIIRFLDQVGIRPSYVKRKMKQYDPLREQEEIERLENFKKVQFYSKFLKSGDLVYDVGANVGNRVQAFLDIGCKVVAIEPQEECYKILENKFGNTIGIIKEGLGAEEDEKTMYIANENTISSFSKEWIDSVKQERFKEYEWNKTVKIKITTLDKLIKEYGQPVFCKIDVEGYEYEVLSGLSQSLNLISLEYTVPEQINRLMDCIKYCLHLNSDYKFNYSVGESMQWQLPESINGEDFLKHVQSSVFLQTNFGDIYVSSPGS